MFKQFVALTDVILILYFSDSTASLMFRVGIDKVL